MVRKRPRSNGCCGRAFRRWPIASGMRKQFRMAVSFDSSRAARVSGLRNRAGTPFAEQRRATFAAISRRSGFHGNCAIPAPVVCADRRVDPDSVPGDSGFLAEHDFRQLHAVCANQHGRRGFPVGMRAFVFRRDLSGAGAGQPVHGFDGNFERNAAKRAFALAFLLIERGPRASESQCARPSHRFRPRKAKPKAMQGRTVTD